MIRILTTLVAVLCINGEAVSMPMKKNTASLPRRHIVEIQAFSFQPQRTVVSPGDIIVWINRDIVPHSVTADKGKWRSSVLEEGEAWEVVVETSGASSYFCEFHPHMTGVLTTR